MQRPLATVIPGAPCYTAHAPSRWRRYLELTKPKVVALITFTALVGALLAEPGLPPLARLVWGILGIALAAASAATLNHVLDRPIDQQMPRTRRRPLPTGQLTTRSALTFAAFLGTAAMAMLAARVNLLTTLLTALSLIGYAALYTLWLKHATPQNIVIGGAAGAAPPVLGWAAVTGSVDSHALSLFLIVFVWTPPHFWALAIARRGEYARAGIPMLPVTHGVEYTRRQILLYTVLLVLATLLPFATHMSGAIYLTCALCLDTIFLSYALRLNLRGGEALAMRTSRFSEKSLMWLVAALLIDHYLMLPTLTARLGDFVR